MNKILSILLLILNSLPYIRRLVRETRELLLVVRIALEDERVTREELLQIMEETEDVGQVIVEIALLVARKVNR